MIRFNLTDLPPLAVSGWEVMLAAYPGQSSFDTAYNSWISLDHLHFVKGNAPIFGSVPAVAPPTGLRAVSGP